MTTLPLLKEFYEHPQVTHKEWEDLVLFCYSRECQYEGLWDEVTRAARGIIFNKVTGEVLCRPFQKFHNASELVGKINLYELARKPFLTLTKIDGSLGLLFKYKNQWHVATKGSFESEQAAWATKWFREHIKHQEILPGYSYLFEIIYPENKIVVDYGDREDMVLLGIIENTTGNEMPYASMKIEGERIGATVVEAVEFRDLDELYEYCKKLPCTEEGFVVTFHNGFKIKVKGDEYCKIHRILSHMTPLAFWGAWDLEAMDIPKDFLMGIPEEFREMTNTLYHQIYDLHHDPFNKVKDTYEELMKILPAEVDHKTFFLTAQDRYGKLAGELIYYYKKNFNKLWLGIHRRVRPTFNILPDSVVGSDRLKRIMEEN
jgi:RNA ligase